MKKIIDTRKEVMRAVIDVIRHKQFYGHILQQLVKIHGAEKYGVTTMGVGKMKDDLLIKLYVCDDYVRYIFDQAETNDQAHKWMQGLLEHEVLHLVFDHLSIELTDRERGAIAVDLVVNSCIDRESLPPIRGGTACFAEDFGGDFVPHKSTMWYYTHLKDNEKFKQLKKQQQQQQQQQQGQGQGQGQGKKQQKGKSGENPQQGQKGQGQGQKNNQGDMYDSHFMWKEAMQDPLLKEMVKDIISKSKELCNKDYGDIPGAVLDQVGDLLKTKKPIVPWGKILRTFCASSMESNLEYTMKRRSKRFGTRPGTKKEDVLNLAVAVDTSGSISDEQLVVFFNEIRWIWKNGAIVTIYEADAAICRTYKFKGKFKGDVHGRGGTDLEPVLKETNGKYDALIYFTDFYAPEIKTRYGIPTLWVLTTELERERFPYKWGRFIKIDDGVAQVA